MPGWIVFPEAKQLFDYGFHAATKCDKIDSFLSLEAFKRAMQEIGGC